MEVLVKDTGIPGCILEFVFGFCAVDRTDSEKLFADVSVLARCCRVCKEWNAVASSDAVWRELCSYVWRRRLRVPAAIQELKPAKQAYRETIRDSTLKTLTVEELTQESGWHFRFKEAAGHDWQENDPYWFGDTPIKVTFYENGTSLWQSGSPRMDGIELTWRWGDSSTRIPASGNPGQRVRATVNGRDVPTYVVDRHPLHGGFIMQSVWVLFTSFPMPPKGTDPYLEDAALQVSFEREFRRGANQHSLTGEIVQYNSGMTGDNITLEELPDNGANVIISIGGLTATVPREVGMLLAASGLPRPMILQLLQQRLLDDDDDDALEEWDDSSGDDEGEGMSTDDDADDDQADAFVED